MYMLYTACLTIFANWLQYVIPLQGYIPSRIGHCLFSIVINSSNRKRLLRCCLPESMIQLLNKHIEQCISILHCYHFYKRSAWSVWHRLFRFGQNFIYGDSSVFSSYLLVPEWIYFELCIKFVQKIRYNQALVFLSMFL